jgi:hypothetical protein
LDGNGWEPDRIGGQQIDALKPSFLTEETT